jgi:hypothetical protein
MKSREELLQELARDPDSVAQYVLEIQTQLTQSQQELTKKEQLLAEARAYIAELKRQLFGPKADKLTPEQEEQLKQLTADLQDQAQRPPPLSQDLLEQEASAADKEKPKRRAPRQMPPVRLDVQRQVLEPQDKNCEHCQQPRPRIGEETTTEYDYQPAKLVVRETVRPKYGECSCGCGQPEMTIAP